MTYYRGFLFSIVVNGAIWMLISYFVNKYYSKPTGFKDEKYLVQYALSKLNSRLRIRGKSNMIVIDPYLSKIKEWEYCYCLNPFPYPIILQKIWNHLHLLFRSLLLHLLVVFQ